MSWRPEWNMDLAKKLYRGSGKMRKVSDVACRQYSGAGDCVGSECAKWRYAYVPGQQAPDTEHADRQGYCGMAGKPQSSRDHLIDEGE